jgi:DNA-binding NarL/FixJ family response regulator
MAKPRTLLAHTDPMVRDTLLRILSPAFEIISTLEDVALLPDAARHARPDVVILDLSALPQTGLQAVSALRDISDALRIVVVTESAQADTAAEAFRCGASAYILQTATDAELLEGIRAAVFGPA